MMELMFLLLTLCSLTLARDLNQAGFYVGTHASSTANKHGVNHNATEYLTDSKEKKETGTTFESTMTFNSTVYLEDLNQNRDNGTTTESTTDFNSTEYLANLNENKGNQSIFASAINPNSSKYLAKSEGNKEENSTILESVTNSNEVEGNFSAFDSVSKLNLTKADIDLIEKYKKEDEVIANEDDDMDTDEVDEGFNNLGVGTYDHNLYGGLYDEYDEYVGDNEPDIDSESEENPEYGIRDDVDDVIRKTITGRRSILRNIFRRRRYFRRIID